MKTKGHYPEKKKGYIFMNTLGTRLLGSNARILQKII